MTRRLLLKSLGALKRKNGVGSCWVCGSVRGMNISRAAYATRCKRCERLGKHTADTLERERLSSLLLVEASR